MRRYDIDWLRVIAIGLLLVYHVSIGFQPWGMMIGFITTKASWPSLWLPMSALNVWRIPLLFFISGMGVFFAMQHRSWLELVKERTLRVWLPFVFGMFAIVPLHIFILQYHNKTEFSYIMHSGHLWFLANIFAYVLLLSPLFYYLKNNPEAVITKAIKTLFSTPFSIVILVAAFVGEALLLKPLPYELYALTLHGLVLGFMAFFFGFCFVLSGAPFWAMIQKWRWLLLAAALTGFCFRQFYFGLANPQYLLVTESQAWILTVLAFGSKYLNRPGRVLTYLSQAAYPIYILHMALLYLGSILIFPLSIPAPMQFLLVLLFTLAGCFCAFEIIRRINFLRPLFGLKWKQD